MSDVERVVVVGAGVSGLAIAHELVSDLDVIVVDSGGVAADTTSRASGVISLALEPISSAVRRFALESFRYLDGRGTFSFNERATVRLNPRTEETVPPSGGEYLDNQGLRDTFPGVFADLAGYDGAWVYHETGMLNPIDYAMTLRWLSASEGVRFLTDRPMTDIVTDDDRVVGIETPQGRLTADAVVIATGWRARSHVIEHVELPIRPLRWHAVTFEGSFEPASPMPLGSEPVERMYWRPRSTGDILIGGNEYFIEHPTEAPSEVDPEFREAATSLAARLFEDVDTSVILQEDCCPTADSATPDGLPIIDAPPEVPDGLVVATGFHGRGVMLSPITGRIVRDLLMEEDSPFSLDPFSLDRFGDRGQSFTYRSHWD